MKMRKIFYRCIIFALFFSTIKTYAFKQSVFDFVFKNETSDKIVMVTKQSKPIGAILANEIGKKDMDVNDTHHFFLLQNPQNDYSDGLPFLIIKMRWLLTLTDRFGKIICQNRVYGWVKGEMIASDYFINTHKWRYDVTAIQNSFDVNMCPFHGAFPKKLPSSYKKNGKKYYSLVIRVHQDNSISFG